MEVCCAGFLCAAMACLFIFMQSNRMLVCLPFVELVHYPSVLLFRYSVSVLVYCSAAQVPTGPACCSLLGYKADLLFAARLLGWPALSCSVTGMISCSSALLLHWSALAARLLR